MSSDVSKVVPPFAFKNEVSENNEVDIELVSWLLRRKFSQIRAISSC